MEKNLPDKGKMPPHSMDEVLKRMLSTPPKQHKDERVNPKPAVGNPAAKKKPAK